VDGGQILQDLLVRLGERKMSERYHDVGDLRSLKTTGTLAKPSEFELSGLEGKNTAEPARIKFLRVVLQLVGMTFIFGIYTLTLVWPSGWSWHTGHHTPHYLQMILGVYATLGVFLLFASRKPLAHLSLIWFTVWSSVVHAVVMAAQALANSEHIAHLWGDVPVLLLVAAILAFLAPRGAAAETSSS
jgi:hypothetical protein